MEYINNEINLNNLSPNLVNLFIPENNINKNILSDWKPPKFNGLDNSSLIIPNYYKINNKNILDIDYYTMIIDDIRNLRKLNEYQLEFIKKLDNDKKQLLFLEFNKLFDVIKSLTD
jgi:hypothetical protein